MLALRNKQFNPAPYRQRNVVDNFLSEFLNDDFFNWTPITRAAVIAGANVYEDRGNLVFELELPGVSREDVKVRLEDHTLTISGEIKRNDTINDDQYLSLGRRYGTFERRFGLPENVVVENGKKINAKLEDGILKVRLPLQKSLQPDTFEIEVK